MDVPQGIRLGHGHRLRWHGADGQYPSRRSKVIRDAVGSVEAFG